MVQTLFNIEAKASPTYFGEWVKRRRKALDLTQEELARRAACSLPALRKIESGERRPSKQLAEMLAASLDVPPEEQTTFVRVARGELNVERLRSPEPSDHRVHQSKTLPTTAQVNLPVQPTRLVGREAELATLLGLLVRTDCRLLTITGMGGIGKTRLAIHTAAAVQENFPDGVTFVSLGALTSPAFIVSAITDALGLQPAGAQDPLKQLTSDLCQKKALLVLDNVDHLLDGVGLFTEILKSAPFLKLLVTSRERLYLQGEWVFEIHGLPIPPDDRVSQLEQYSSIALFIQRAQQVQVGFELSPEVMPWVARICRLVEGLPLAIELAAAWVSMLPCEQISQEIQANLDFLTANIRDVPERHRSLRAAFDHSWKRLNEDTQAVFTKLSVFQGGFTRQAAEQVAGASLPLLSALMVKSLVYRKSDSHYEMHPLVKQYAAEKLQEKPDLRAQTLEQHRHYFVDFLSQLHFDVRGSNMQAALKTIHADLDNVLEAWRGTVAERKFAGLRPAEKCLYDYFELRGRQVDGYTVLSMTADGLRAEQALHPEDIELRTLLGLVLIDQSYFGASFIKQREVIGLARQGYEFLRDGIDQTAFGFAALWIAFLHYNLGDFASTAQFMQESLEIFRRCGDERGVAAALGSQARLAMILRQFDEGAQIADQAVDIYRAYKDHEGLCRILIIQSELAMHAGQPDKAERLLDEALELSKSIEVNSMIEVVLCTQAELAQSQNHLERARSLIEQSLAYLSSHDSAATQSLIFRRFGTVLTAQGDFQEAHQWLIKTLHILVMLEIISPALDVLLDYARLLSRQGSTQKALSLVFFIISDPRARPLTKFAAEQVGAGILPGMDPAQIQEAKEFAQNQTIETIVSEIAE